MMISICIPTYEMYGQAERLLRRSFDILKKQTYKDFEVVISDNSKDHVVKNLCESPEYESLKIKYFRNLRIGMAPNTNEAIKKASGDLIKILYMDDYFADENSLADIAENFKGYWMVTGCKADKSPWWRKKKHFPKYSEKITEGRNTIGSPSVLTIKNEHLLLFDEQMTWVLDCDYYKRLYDKYGAPTILNKVNVIIGVSEHQTTNHLKRERKKNEVNLLKERYKGK